MIFKIFHAAIAAALLFASSALAHPVEEWMDLPRHYPKDIVTPQNHTIDLDNMNLTAVPAQYRNGTLDPSQVVGRLKFCDRNGTCEGGCTASLIDSRLIITARHAAVPEGKTGVFFQGYNHGDFSAKANVEHMFALPEGQSGVCRIQNDFTVMVLSEPLGDTVGSFGVRLPDAENFNKPMFSRLGYPSYLETGCEITECSENPVFESGIQLPSPYRPYDRQKMFLPPNATIQIPPDGLPADVPMPQFPCDNKTGPIFSDSRAYSGESGSALWDDEQNIWGVLSNGNAIWASTGWASGDLMLAAVNQARKEFP